MTAWLGDPNAPYDEGAAVTPNDSTVIEATRALWVGTGGTIAVTLEKGQDVTLTGVPNGTLLPLRVTAVKSTGSSGIAGVVALR